MYAIIDAPGYFGAYATIWETHTDEKAARHAKHKGGKSVQLISGCHKAKGDKISQGELQALINTGSWRVIDVKRVAR